jgi:hypothetical protein
MNPTSQHPEGKFPFSFGHNPMNNVTLYLTLGLSALLGFVVILLIYAVVFGLNPANRWEYGLLISVPPALGALLVVKLTRVFESWLGVFTTYVALFVLAVIVQAFARNFGA